MLHILGNLTDHIATSQLATIKSQVTYVCMIKGNTKKNEPYMKIGSSCATFYISYTTVNISDFLDNILKLSFWHAKFN